MGKQRNPHLVAWQEAARERLQLVSNQKYHGRLRPLADDLGVSHTLVSLVLRSIQPPSRNLMARLGAIEGVNPRWAATGEGEPFLPDTRGTLPVSGVLLPGPPADHPGLLTGERFAVAPAFERATCYFWRLPAGHPATAVDAWRLLPGDLLLLETSRAVVEAPGGLHRKMCVLDGGCLERTEPAYGAVTADGKRRLVFSDDQSRLRFLDPHHSNFAPPDNSSPKKPKDPNKPRPRRTIRDLGREAAKEAQRAVDPWSSLPSFNVTHVLAVQLLMVRP